MFRSTLLLGLLTLLCSGYQLTSQPSTILLPGTERLLAFDVDSTGRWWAITEPAFGLQRLIVDGTSYGVYDSVERPILAPNGESVAIIGYRGVNCLLIRDGDTLQNGIERVRLVTYAGMTSRLWWSTSDVGVHMIRNGREAWTTSEAPSTLATDPLMGVRVAWVLAPRDGTLQTLIVNGNPIASAEQIRLYGVWSTGEPVYALFAGTWSLMIGERTISSGMQRISDCQVDRAGTRAAWIQQRLDRDLEVCFYDESMTEPWTSKRLTTASDLVLSNEHALLAYRGGRLDQRHVFFNAAEYPCGYQCGPPAFSTDGATMIYASQEDDNAIVINGKRLRVTAGVPMSDPLASNPDGSVVAWSSRTTLIRVVPDLNITTMGAMCDSMSRTIYDRRNDRFTALGRIGDRLLLLTAPAH
jgi:hypothetical protein